MFLTSEPMGVYQPLSWLSYALDYTLWGMTPTGYHLTSLALHCLNAALFFLLCLRLLELALPLQAKEEPARTRLLCALAALLFSIHPLRVEPVAWLSDRRDVLCGAFYLGALLAYLSAQTASGLRRRWLGVSLCAYALSLLGKGVGVSLPATLLILDAYPLGRLPGDPRRWLERAFRPVLLEKFPYLALGLAAAAASIAGTAVKGTFRSLAEHGWSERAAQAFYGLAFYVRKTLVPVGLSPLYELPSRVDPLEPRFLLSAGAVTAAAIMLARKRREWPGGLAAALHYTAVLLPVLGPFQFGIQLVADRYSYLSCLPWPILAAGISLKRGRRTALLMAGAVLLLGILTWRQSGFWHDSAALWRRVIELDPDAAVAHKNLALFLASQGRLEESVPHFRAVVRLHPKPADALSDLGLALTGLGRTREAMEPLRLALEIKPGHFQARNNLGLALASLGRPREAEAQFRLALELDPASPHAWNNLGMSLARQGKTAEAARHFRKALGLKPDYPEARRNLSIALGELRKGSVRP